MEKKEPLCTVVRHVDGTATMENSIKFHKILKIELPYDSASPLLGTYPKEAKSLS